MKAKTAQPVPAVLLGLCPLLCVCVNVQSGLGVGIVTFAAYALAMPAVSLADRLIPGRWNAGYMRVLLLAVASAGWSVLAGILLEAFLPALYAQIGVYVPLSVVFCVLLDLSGFSDAWDTSAAVRKLTDGGILILTLALTGLIREFFGAGTVCGVTVLPSGMTPVGIFTRIPGAFLAAAFILIACNAWNASGETGGKEDSQ